MELNILSDIFHLLKIMEIADYSIFKKSKENNKI